MGLMEVQLDFIPALSREGCRLNSIQEMDRMMCGVLVPIFTPTYYPRVLP